MSCDFLFLFCSNCVSILYRYLDITTLYKLAAYLTANEFTFVYETGN